MVYLFACILVTLGFINVTFGQGRYTSNVICDTLNAVKRVKTDSSYSRIAYDKKVKADSVRVSAYITSDSNYARTRFGVLSILQIDTADTMKAKVARDDSTWVKNGIRSQRLLLDSISYGQCRMKLARDSWSIYNLSGGSVSEFPQCTLANNHPLYADTFVCLQSPGVNGGIWYKNKKGFYWDIPAGTRRFQIQSVGGISVYDSMKIYNTPSILKFGIDSAQIFYNGTYFYMASSASTPIYFRIGTNEKAYFDAGGFHTVAAQGGIHTDTLDWVRAGGRYTRSDSVRVTTYLDSVKTPKTVSDTNRAKYTVSTDSSRAFVYRADSVCVQKNGAVDTSITITPDSLGLAKITFKRGSVTNLNIRVNASGNTSVMTGGPSTTISVGINNAAKFVVSSNGVFCGGSSSPTAILHVAAGTTALPSILINKGVVLTTPVSGAIEYGAGGRKLNFTDSLLTRQSFVFSSYAGMYVDTTSVPITITTANTYYGWTFAHPGISKIVTVDTTNATADRFVVGVGGAGTYIVSYNVNAALSAADTVKCAVHVNSALQTKTRSINRWALIELHTLAASSMLSLADNDTVDLRFSAGSNGTLVNVFHINFLLNRIE